MKSRRKIIEIDRNNCDGCGLCLAACEEGALALDKENKAVLVKEIYCDGIGACLDVCPSGALKIIEKECEDFDTETMRRHVIKTREKKAGWHLPKRESDEGPEASTASELNQWPIQLHLISPHASFFKGSDLLIAADCTAFALGSFHQSLLKRRTLVIACPKLDNVSGYEEKLTEIVKNNAVSSLTVVTMKVPCCAGLFRLVERAAQLSGIKIDITRKIVSIHGELAS